MLGAMFLAFILQVVFRYLLNLPIGWTHEISVMLWVWLVLWGAAFVVRENEEIRFDLIYGSVGPNARRIMCLVTAVALVVLRMSLPAVVDYVTFMKVERTAYLKVRFDFLFSIYVIFLPPSSAIAGSGGRRCAGEAPAEFDPTKGGSGI